MLAQAVQFHRSAAIQYCRRAAKCEAAIHVSRLTTHDSRLTEEAIHHNLPCRCLHLTNFSSPEKPLSKLRKGMTLAPRFDGDGLIPVVTTDYESGEVLGARVHERRGVGKDDRAGRGRLTGARPGCCSGTKARRAGLCRSSARSGSTMTRTASGFVSAYKAERVAMLATGRASIAQCRLEPTMAGTSASPRRQKSSTQKPSTATPRTPRSCKFLPLHL